MSIVRHHLLECILWPNGDGTFRKIVNLPDRLQKLGIYDDYKLTIPIERGVHASMHIQFKKGTEYEYSGENTSGYGRTGDKHPLYGKSGSLSATWKGDKAGPMTMYKRAKKLYQSGQMTEEEFQTFRDAVNEDQKLRREKRKKANLLP